MKLFLFFLPLSTTLISCIITAQQDDEHKRLARIEIINKVRNHLLLDNILNTKLTVNDENTTWLRNSNKIGLGYNPLVGSPVCYTGKCQGDGFRRSLFKLVFTQPAQGSCTNKIIPENIELDCLQSGDIVATTESIATLSELSKTTSDGISFNIGAEYGAFSAGYGYSQETTFMIDNIVKKNTTAMYTTAKITYAKLSMFEPKMELSDNFRYVIEQMPCCDYDEQIDQYLNEFVINYFGLTFITELMLGGIAQEVLFIGNTELKQMEANGYSASHSANIGFFITMKMELSSSQSQEQREEFLRSVKMSRSTKLGGDSSLDTIKEWKKSVPSSPIVMHFSVKDIRTLLSKQRFPTETAIKNKSRLLDMAIQRYLRPNDIFCYNNCTGETHGICETTGYFLFGNCKCKLGWYGIDCSKRVVTRDCQQPLTQNKTCLRPRWSTYGATVAGGNKNGSNLNQLSFPTGIILDATNTMYIADTGNHRILKWKQGYGGGQVIAGITGQPGSASNQLNSPTDVEFDQHENLYVLDERNTRVQKFVKGSAEGTTVASGFDYVFDMHADGKGNVYIADYGGNKVIKFVPGDTYGLVVAGGNGQGNNPSQLTFNTAVFVDECENLYINDYWNYRIQKWAKGANFGVTVGTWTVEEIKYSHCLKVDGNGNMFMTDYVSNSVYKWEPNVEKPLRVAGSGKSGSDNVSLDRPIGFAFDSDGNLFVVDQSNHRVQKFTLEDGIFGC